VALLFEEHANPLDPLGTGGQHPAATGTWVSMALH
jgi:hypothetical protein